MNKPFKLIFLLFLFIAVEAKSEEPLAILLTWSEDPTTTMTIDWHSMSRKPQLLYFRKKGDSNWQNQESKVHPFPYSDRIINRVTLRNLETATAYEIKFAGDEKVYYFRTMPENTIHESVRIAIGGDTMHDKAFLEKTNTVAASYDPHFVIIGGDMAYENAAPEAVEKVYNWLDAVKNTLITNDKRLIPIVVGLGNHEVAGGYHSPEKYSGSNEDREKYAAYFYNLFAFPGHPGYNVLDFGKYLSVFMLDSHHNNPISGKQTEWLSAELQKRKDVLHIIPVYHIPAYPSVREFNGARSEDVRKHWVPLFEEHGIKFAFENHDHAYKRTYPIKGNKIDENGIVFMGDGAWGVRTREFHSLEETWYLKNAASQRHFILLTIQGPHQQLITISEDGEVIDTYPEILQPSKLIKEMANH